MKIAASLVALYVSIAVVWFVMLTIGIGMPPDFLPLLEFIAQIILPEAIAVTIAAIACSAIVSFLVKLIVQRRNDVLVSVIDLGLVFIIVVGLGSRGHLRDLAHYVRLALEITALAAISVLICNFLLMRSIDAAIARR